MWRAVGAACLLPVLLAGCGSATQHHESAAATHHGSATAAPLDCPANLPTHDEAPLAPDPVEALVCLTNEPPQKRLSGVPLSTDVARTLARLIGTAPTADAKAAARCAPKGSQVTAVIRFRYPDSSVIDVTEAEPSCADIVTVSGRSYAIPQVVADLILAASAPMPDELDTAPDLVGMPVAEARSVARRAGLSIGVDGEVVRGGAPGTVLLQGIPHGGDLAVILNAPAANPCRPAQLGVRYLAGSAGGGSDGGTVRLRNTSASWCELRGPIRVTGLDASGRPVTASVSAQVAAHLELSPRASAELLLVAEYRDDPVAADGLCQPHWVIPKTWRLEFPSGAHHEVPNAQAQVGHPPGMQGLITCRGRFGAGPAQLTTS